ncbi:MAG: PD-(D/E)XK nuclease family protein [Actinomycetota bacterium]|nr:PD-(D/E)XK nuclease family protein [Actinomycetota bacterium]
MPVYSRSRIDTFLSCPLKYRFKYIDGIRKEEENVEPWLGNVVHKTLHELLRLKKDFRREPKLEAAIEIFEKMWSDSVHEKITIHDEFANLDDYRRRGLMFIENFFEAEKGRDYGEIVSLEGQVNFKIDGYSFTGYIDRLQKDGSTYHIVDYKTSKSPLSQEAADRDEQLALYEIGVRQNFPQVEKVVLHWHMLSDGTVVDSSRSPEQLESLMQKVPILVNEIEAEKDFLPLESGLCNWCEYKEECQSEREKRTIAHEEMDFASMVEEYETLYEEKSELDSSLKKIEKAMEKLAAPIVDECLRRDCWSVEGKEHILNLERSEKISIPGKGGKARDELERILREARRFDSLFSIERNAFLKALGEGMLGELTETVKGMLEEREEIKIKVLRRKTRPESGS